MQQLDFKGYSTTEWREFKRIHHEKFWQELHAKTLKDATKLSLSCLSIQAISSALRIMLGHIRFVALKYNF
jgi:hypothetical protein